MKIGILLRYIIGKVITYATRLTGPGTLLFYEPASASSAVNVFIHSFIFLFLVFDMTIQFK